MTTYLFASHLTELILGIVALYLVPKLARWIMAGAQRAHIQTSILQQQQLEAFLLQQVMRVKEEAAAAIKAGGPKWSSDQKLEEVIAEVVKRFPAVSETEAQQLAHALLSSVGEGATMIDPKTVADFMSGLDRKVPFGKA